jgi:very-short-patch-repair endonuclease
MLKVSIPKGELEELYFRQNYSIRDLSKHYHHDLKTILKLFREHGITSRNSVDAWVVRKSTKTIPQISRDNLYREYILNRISTEKISSTYAVPVRSVRRYLKRYNITPRIRFPRFDTSIERILEDELARREIGHYKQYCAEGICRADKAFPFEKIAVFCDGRYWHSFESAQRRDEKVNRQLSASGWIVLRFTEEEINNNVQQIVNLIVEFLHLTRRNSLWAQDRENGKKKGT